MNVQILQGRYWNAKKIENVYIVTINEGVSVITGLTHFIMDQKIVAGNISGAAIANHMMMHFFNPHKKCNEYGEFSDQSEIINILGSFFMIREELKLSLDMVLKKEKHTTLSCSLLEARINGMNNFFIFPAGRQVPFKNQFLDIQNWN